MNESESDRDERTGDGDPTVRLLESGDVDRVLEIAESSMTASYAMSPNEIEAIREEEFEGNALRERAEGSSGSDVFVAEAEGVLAGFVETQIDDETGAIRWLHVDPEHRGRGVGTALFEHAVADLEDEGVDVRGIVLASNTSAGAFFERFDFEEVDERTVDVGDREAVEYIYAECAEGESGAADEGSDADDATDLSDVDLPDSVTIEDDETLSLGEEHYQGTEGLFVLTYTDADREERYGYYCTNCETADVSVDTMDRLKCQTCGNTHKPTEDYDGSYL
jgi:ribosomal protein S18 acetylase RimI-like enzyme